MAPPFFQVLRCYKCLVFQVHQAKKAIKWECKLCGEKQSIKKRHGIGTAKECRVHVQKLNLLSGEANETLESKATSDAETEEAEDPSPPKLKRVFKSKWKSYVDEVIEHTENKDESNEDYIGDIEVVLEIPTKKQKKTKWQPPTAYNRKVNEIIVNTKNCTDENYFYKNINESETHCHIEEAMEKDKSIPFTHSGQALLTSTSKVSEVIVKTLPNLNKNSKWVRYVEEDEDTQPFPLQDTADSLPQKINTTLKHHSSNMFSLNDDINLDEFLDF